MKHTVLPILCICLMRSLCAGQCSLPGSEVIHANDIRTRIFSDGHLFTDFYDANFQVPFAGPSSPHAIYAASVWIGGYDRSVQLRLAAQKFLDLGPYKREFWPGPLLPGGEPFDIQCAHWDTIWTVAGYEIKAHIKDYLQDQVVDVMNPAIFGWPAAGNIFFQEINGFEMPAIDEQYAPFYDSDMDGMYEPQDGEYPLPKGVSPSSVPGQITWHVFHDALEHRFSQGEPLGVEFQQTCYAFYCQDDPIFESNAVCGFSTHAQGYGNPGLCLFRIVDGSRPGLSGGRLCGMCTGSTGIHGIQRGQH